MFDKSQVQLSAFLIFPEA